MSKTLCAVDAVRMADVASMQKAVLELQTLASQARPAKELPPLEFALRYGVVPPVLAGRAKETAVLRSMVSGIQDRKGDQCLLGLHGIRGQGKTALIRLVEDMALQAGIHVVELDSSGTKADFARSVMDAESLSSTSGTATTKESGVGFSAAAKADARTSRTQRAAESRAPLMTVDSALRHRLENRRENVLIILDEAHTLRKEAGQALFKAHQSIGVKGAALGMAFAGTPDLPDHLSDMGVTFTERPGRHGRTPLGPITDANAVMAVLAPFAERGALPAGAAPNAPGGIVEGVAKACCGYPYYTQLLGDALHQAWAGDEQPNLISQEHWRRALETFATERQKHYQRRFLELREIGAVECARNLASALKERGAITQDVLGQCVIQGLKERSALEKAGKILREEAWLDGLWSAKGGMASALLHLGFLWSPEGSAGDSFQAGIPSLADYVLEAAPSADRGADELGETQWA